MKIHIIIICAFVSLVFAGCSSQHTVLPYFTDLQEPVGTIESIHYAPDIKPDDELFITINSSVPETTANYNLPLSNPATRASASISSSPRQQTVVVTSEGDITLPILGTIHVAGMTTEELQTKLTEMVRKDVSDAIVNVTLVNFTVVVAGEVTQPGTVIVTRTRFSILDALGAAGDLTPYGERSKVLVIREDNGKRSYARLDLNSSEMLTSPYFYLQQNDYIYVEPNDVRQSNAKYNQDKAYKLSVISTIVSAASVIASMVIALCIN